MTVRHSFVFSLLAPVLITSGSDAYAQDARESVRSAIAVIDADGRSKQVLHASPRDFGAPNWSPDGSYLLLNAEGKLWKLPAKGGPPESFPAGLDQPVDINHAIAPDGRSVAVTTGPIVLLPSTGGRPRRLTEGAPSYVHAWSPDGKTVAFVANRGQSYNLYAVPAAGGPERPLTAHSGLEDCPDYSPDGRWIYFTSDRAGGFDIWRIPTEGAGPGDAQAERITSDDREDWSPHPSPDGKWLIFLSYKKGTQGHPGDQDVTIRRIPLPGAKVETAKPVDVVRFVGGHGSLGSSPWSPDSRRFAFVSSAQPPPSLRIVLFTPSDLEPPAGAQHRLDQIADAAERFLTAGMKAWKYPPANAHLFQRKRDGSVEALFVKGDHPVASGRYAQPVFADEVIRKASAQYHIAGPGHCWWIFVYVGDRPKRFDDWRGHGDSHHGGWALVNYDTIPGEIRPDLGLSKGFNAEFFLKGCVHELGHAFGLPHIGPNLKKKLGNSLMGPNNDVYAARKLPKADDVYLTEASAAMLWKHPIVSGESNDRALQPSVSLNGYRAVFGRSQGRVTITGKLASDLPAHSVIVFDDLGHPDDAYWRRSYAARVADDGTFRIVIDDPAKANGHYKILFCFQNGAIAGDGEDRAEYGAIVKSYRYRDGTYRFGD